jgi:CRP-like cAMP-binding protein
MSTSAFTFRGARQTESYAAGAVIFEQGQPGECMYVIVRGEVDILVDGRYVDTLKEGSILGEMALITSDTRTGTAVARSACELAPVNRSQFMFMVQETPYFALKVMRVMAERLRGSPRAPGSLSHMQRPSPHSAEQVS